MWSFVLNSQVRIVGTTFAIRGFLVQARMPDNGPPAAPILRLGSFQIGATNQAVLDCGNATATIGHNETHTNVDSVQFTWNAPSVSLPVDFYYTVVRRRYEHFDALSARQQGSPPATTTMADSTTTIVDSTTTIVNSTTTMADSTTTMADNTTSATNTDPMVTLPPPDNTRAPERLRENYRFFFKSPDQCKRADCDVFIGIDTNTGNSSYLDIYLEGTAEGWIAVGFSNSSNMFSSDVVACNRFGDDIIALDTWNEPPALRDSPTDTVQNVYLFQRSYVDGRLSCRIVKRISPADGLDLDLDQELYLIYAFRRAPSNELGAISSHAGGGTQVRGVSGNRVNPAQATGGVGGSEFDLVHRRRLVQAHGTFMIIAWPLLAATAIFFARFMKPALPNGEWFQVHRALMITSLFVGVTGFILIFISLKDQNGLLDVSSGTGVAHIVIGVIVMTLHIVNPIIAIFRCKPDEKFRWIFNLVHGNVIGSIAEALGLTNVALGLSLFSRNFSRFAISQAPLWLYVAWTVFNFVVIVGLVIYFCFTRQHCDKNSSCKQSKDVAHKDKPSDGNESRDKEISDRDSSYRQPIQGVGPDGIELEIVNDKDKPSDGKETPPKKTPSKDSTLRWAAFVLYMAVTIPIMVAVIVMVALP